MKEGGSVGVCKDTSSAADGCVNKKNRIFFFLKQQLHWNRPLNPSLLSPYFIEANLFWLFLHGCMLVMWLYLNVHIENLSSYDGCESTQTGRAQLMCETERWNPLPPPYPSGCPHMISLCHMCQVRLWRWAEVTAIVCIYRTSQDTTQSSTKIPGMHVHTLFTSQSCPKEQKNWFCLCGFVT